MSIGFQASRALTVAIVTETFPPEVNGVARTIAEFAAGLRARGHSIRVVRPRQNPADLAACGDGYAELLLPGLPVPRYPQLRFGLPAKGALMRAWADERPDVVHVVTEGPLGGSALAAASALGIPTATDFHTNFHAYSGHYGVGWMRRALTAYLRRFHNRAGCTMVPTVELAVELAQLGIDRLRVVGRGVAHEVFTPARRSAQLRLSWGAHDDTPVALCVSRFAPEKNFALVLEAHAAMVEARPDTCLVLVGDGPLATQMKRSGAGCVIAGRLVNGELSAHYASADIFLFPSVTETFGNVTLEAMASGLAVSAYRYAAAREHIVHGLSGMLAPVGDRESFIANSVWLARNLPLARRMGREARRVAESLGWDEVVVEFERELLRTIAAPAAEPDVRSATA